MVDAYFNVESLRYVADAYFNVESWQYIADVHFNVDRQESLQHSVLFVQQLNVENNIRNASQAPLTGDVNTWLE